MPELAEVQTLVHQLDAALAGSHIAGMNFLYPQILQHGSADTLADKQLHAVSRWGKRLHFQIGDTPQVLVVSLGMTGGWRLGDKPDKHLVAELHTSQGTAWYTDPRRFSRMHIFESPQEAESVLGARIGVDAASCISDQELRQALGSGQTKLKAALLDQSKLSGIGNYLADEIAWQAKLSPYRPLSQITPDEWTALNQSRQDVINRALKYGGLSFSDYLHLDGGKGNMSSQLQAYGRSGQPCMRCNATLLKSVVAGRGTHYCENCQR